MVLVMLCWFQYIIIHFLTNNQTTPKALFIVLQSIAILEFNKEVTYFFTSNICTAPTGLCNSPLPQVIGTLGYEGSTP
uniref:Putative ovule protein n=1 Tax=Solanum chacoense TaxID=4108 RepID=A0A0V0HA17_SOLCH